MKIALITDQHFGVRGDSQIFLDYQKKFYSDIFFPYLEENDISEIIDLGDTFDRRKYINFNTLSDVKGFYFDKLKQIGANLRIIVGNHSTFYKTTNDVNSPDLILREYDNITTYGSPKEVTIGGLDMLFIPWMNPENTVACMDAIKQTKSYFLLGHFELSGEKLRSGFEFSHGIRKSDFKKFEQVLSGHYHHKIDKANFKYLGAPYEYDWGDWNTQRGFHILDTETRSITFIENPYKLFKKIIWNDVEGSKHADVSTNADDYKDKYIKVIVKHKSNPYIFDQWIEDIEKCGPHQVVVEDLATTLSEEEIDIENVEDTITTLRKYVTNTFPDNKNLLYFIENLYEEALSIE